MGVDPKTGLNTSFCWRERVFRPIIVVHFEGVETHFGHGETEIQELRTMLLVCVPQEMFNRSSWEHSYLSVRGEILASDSRGPTAKPFAKDFFSDQERKRWMTIRYCGSLNRRPC